MKEIEKSEEVNPNNNFKLFLEENRPTDIHYSAEKILNTCGSAGLFFTELYRKDDDPRFVVQEGEGSGNGIWFGDYGLDLRWGYDVNSKSITYTPHISGYTESSYDRNGFNIEKALASALGHEPITVPTPEPVVNMPIPEWSTGIPIDPRATTVFVSEALALKENLNRLIDEAIVEASKD